MSSNEKSPMDILQEDYELSDEEMMQLFGMDADTQARKVKKNPSLSGVGCRSEVYVESHWRF